MDSDFRRADLDLTEEQIGRVVRVMRDGLGQPLTVDDLARAAMFSKFHFSRLFKQVTGISPGRFLYAMRLQEAKRLLVATSATVTEISYRVGYNSVGTFSARFRSSVGVSPSRYRQVAGRDTRPPSGVGGAGDLLASAKATRVVRGCARSTLAEPIGHIFLGVFPGRIPQGRAIRCTMLDRPGPYVLTDLPSGHWYVLAYSTRQTARQESAPHLRFAVGVSDPVVIAGDTRVVAADVWLRPMREVDPPLLLAPLAVRHAAEHDAVPDESTA
jgi:AraC-like DNA-binding protein